MTAALATAPDQVARDRISGDLAATLFVEAGAGSGKTRALVDRVVQLVTTGTATLDTIAAITFTEKAAAELRDRVRRALTAELADGGDAGRAARRRAALDDLDGAAIGTLHSFAQRILGEHPVEARLPPRIEVLDEVASAVEFDDRWGRFLDRLLADPAVERPLLLATACGVRPDGLRLVALAFNQNWDLARDHAPSTPGEVTHWTGALDRLLAEVGAIVAERHRCCDDDDKLLPQLERLEAWARRVDAASDEYTQLALLSQVPGGSPHGQKGNWPGYDLAALKLRFRSVRDQAVSLRRKVGDEAVRRLAVDLRRFTLEAADERRRAGELEFHDLLVLARDVLRDPEHGPTVRRALRQRYRHLLIDEFQDTDPIQIDLAVRIAGDDEAAPDAPWHDVATREGHLFFVGDPKQSIYRFRRADISVFLRAADRFGADGRRLALTTNFRTGRAIVEDVNLVFGDLMRAKEVAGLPSQPAYAPLVAVRPDAPVGPPVAVLGATAHDDAPSAAVIRQRESADVAAVIHRVLDEGWLVEDAGDGAGAWRPARLGDITILLPTRTSLPALEDALGAGGISYRAESASLVYASRLVRDVLLTLRALDDPSDELAVVAALRSPLFACGDDDLYRYRRTYGGSFDHGAPPPASAPAGDPVAAGLAYLRELHEARLWATPSELADRVVRDRRVLELGEADGRPRDLWRRVRFVIDQARAWTDATNGTLRQYLAWIRQQTAEGSRVAEAVLPETDDDAVRIMTVHAAKGLEFPVTILAGLSTQPQNRRAGAEVIWPPGEQCLIRIGNAVLSEAYEAQLPLDEQMSHDERIRLLYVACTRAQDHLVISLHRKTRAGPASSATTMTSAELLASALDDRLADLPQVGVDPEEQPAAAGAGGSDPVPEPATEVAAALPDLDDWRRARDEAVAVSAIPTTVAATALTDDGRPDVVADPGLHKRPRDLDLPPWQKGRYGTAIGRAVHAVMQTIDLATGAGKQEAVAAQAAAEGVIGHEPRVAALVDAALASPAVAEAAGSAHWRELYVGVPLEGGRTLEGYVDLLYRREEGLVVVDYKTGPAGLDADLDALVARYRMQGAAYALAVADATGEPVVEVTFVFLTPEGPAERRLPDLPQAVADVRRLAATPDGRLVTT